MTTALYRRYRPESFADVIGQEHVTEPLMQALRTGRVNHAYLFSGPRGCGKTTSARILARCLNCEQGPTPTPCGQCESCVALARGGSGSVDVIEIDAASHGGVEDARDLRERASFGPANSRYKIYIIDEAHMVTSQGFNALLKIVEEPPEHVKFVFATTEPEKVIGTIRSRTHHYPFRLVPPKKLTDYMESLLRAENVPFEPGVLSFVTRAGGGSVRDSLSVLDQLIAGSTDAGLTYAGVAALLGFTDDELLDGIIEAFAAGDSAAVFRQLDKVIESGSDPRRFVEDLLERLRDLIVVAAVAEGAGAVLRTVPEDQLERMRQQAASFGAGALSRAADVINAGLTEMSGATSPRLQLELMCARVLLPGIAGLDGYAARLDRMERRLDMGALPSSAATGSPRRAPSAAASTSSETRPTVQPPTASEPESSVGRPNRPQGASGEAAAPSAGSGQPSAAAAHPSAPQPTEARTGRPQPSMPAHRGSDSGQTSQSSAAGGSNSATPANRPQRPEASERPTRPEGAGRPEQSSGAGQKAASQPSAQQPVRGGLTTDDVRRAWPDVLDRVFRIKRVTWTLLSQNAQVMEFDGQRLVLGANSEGLAGTMSRGQHPEVVRQALIEAIGVDVQVEARVMDAGQAPANPASHAAASTAANPAANASTNTAPRPSANAVTSGGAQAAPGMSQRPAPAQQASHTSGFPTGQPSQSHQPHQSSQVAQPSQRPQSAQPSQTSQAGGSVPPVADWDEPAPEDDLPPDPREFGGAQFGGAPGRQVNAWGDAQPSARPGQPGPPQGQQVQQQQGHVAQPGHQAGQQGHVGQPGAAAQGQQARGQNPNGSGGGQSSGGGWRARTGWNGQGTNSAPTRSSQSPQPAQAGHSGGPAAGAVSSDVGLATAAAQSSAWGSPGGDWSHAAGPAPEWASGEAASPREQAQGQAQEAASTSASDTPDWMEDEPETDVEAVYDPLPPKEQLGANSAPAGTSASPQPATEAVDERQLTPRQRAEKAAREAAQQAEDAKLANGGSRYDDASVSRDDEDIENSDAVGLPVIKSVLGGTVIKEEGPEGTA